MANPKFKKNKINNYFMKKLLFLIMLIPMFALNIFAGDFVYSQPIVINDYNTDNLGNMQLLDFAGSVNNILELGANNYSYDVDFEFAQLNRDMYFLIENYIVNNTIDVIYHFDLGETTEFIAQELTMEELGTYYFKFENSYEKEPLRVYIGFNNDSFVGTMKIHSSEKTGLTDTMETFVGYVSELININIMFWRIIYYLFIFVIIIVALGMVVGSVFKLIEWSEKLSKKKHEVLSKRK